MAAKRATCPDCGRDDVWLDGHGMLEEHDADSIRGECIGGGFPPAPPEDLDLDAG